MLPGESIQVGLRLNGNKPADVQLATALKTYIARRGTQAASGVKELLSFVLLGDEALGESHGQVQEAVIHVAQSQALGDAVKEGS